MGKALPVGSFFIRSEYMNFPKIPDFNIPPLI